MNALIEDMETVIYCRLHDKVSWNGTVSLRRLEKVVLPDLPLRTVVVLGNLSVLPLPRAEGHLTLRPSLQ